MRWFSAQPEVVETMPAAPESFLTGTGAVYAEQMLELYEQDPLQVHESWRTYFDNLNAGVAFDPADYNKPTAAVSLKPTQTAAADVPSDSLGIAHLIRAYQVNGHTAANLDPLDTYSKECFPFRPCAVMDLSQTDGYPPQLTPEYHGFTKADYDRQLNFKGTSTGGNKGYLEELAKNPNRVTLRQIVTELRKTYTGSLAVEYMHMGDQDQMNWMRERIEHPRWLLYDKEKKSHILERLCFADTFETFLAHKFNTTKRFGLDGGEAIVPALKDAIDRASELGAHSFVLGMPHRGRLNVLANVMRKPMPLIFSEFQGTHYNVDDHLDDPANDTWGMSGDVKCMCNCLDE